MRTGKSEREKGAEAKAVAGPSPLGTKIMRVADIRVGKRHRKHMGDINGLAESIKEVGLLQLPVVTPDGLLVAGQRRLEAIKKLRRSEVPVHIEDVPSVLEAEYAENAFRKALTISERVSQAQAFDAAMPERRGRNNTDNCPEYRGRETRDYIAKRAGFCSGKTFERAKKVVNGGVPELVDAMDEGRASIGAAAEVAAMPRDEQRKVVAAGNVGKMARELRELRRLRRERARPVQAFLLSCVSPAVLDAANALERATTEFLKASKDCDWRVVDTDGSERVLSKLPGLLRQVEAVVARHLGPCAKSA